MSVEEILAALQAIIDGAQSEDGEPRELTEDERSQIVALEKRLEQARADQEIRGRQDARNQVRPGLATRKDPAAAAVETRAFSRYLRSGNDTEVRALGKASDAAGGYLVPDEWRDKLVECMKSFGGFANAAEEMTSNDGRKWIWPTLSDETTGTPNEGVITAEAAQFTGGADPVFGENTLDVFKYTTSGAGDLPIRVSVELLQDSGTDVDALLRRLMGRRIHRKQSRDFVVGVGTTMPKGILNGTADAEMTTTNTFNGTNNGYPLLLSIVTLLDQEYLNNASWLMNKTTYAQILGLVDTAGRPLIMPSTAGIGDGVGGGMTILGYPVIIDSYAPNAADDTNFMAFGDFRQAYVVRRVRELEVIADPYARKNHGQVEYVAWQRAGGTVQDRCAYILVKGKDA
jgi:HK97 family phage major capsid protein